MKKCRFISIILIFIIVSVLLSIPSAGLASDDYGRFPQKNAWYQATPSVVWYNDPESTTTLEVHVVGRKDVKRVFITQLGSSEPEGERELFDDGTHGDKAPGDNVFTLADVVLSGYMPDRGFNTWLGFLRVELKNGTRLGNNYGMSVGLVDPKYKNVFFLQDLGNGLSATPYAFFIQDGEHQIFDSYPVSEVYCGKKNYEAYKKLYTVFPDEFDFITLMPGMQIFRPDGLAENVPYDVSVSNDVKNIGLPIRDDTKKFGSAGRLKSVIYSSFSSIDIIDHEIGHTWGVNIGYKIGLIDKDDPVHWNGMADIQGQMGLYYSEGGNTGHFAYNGDRTWRLISSGEVEPYSPLELYLMGLIPSSEIPDVHILKSPDFSDPEHITAKSYKTVTAGQIVASAGGERIPSSADARKEFNMAFIVTQDLPYNDAAYAYFSLLSKKLMTHDPPDWTSMLAPFYWATGGRATLNTYLGDYGVLDLPASAPTPGPSIEAPALESTAAKTPAPTFSKTPASGPPVVPAQADKETSAPILIILCALAVTVIMITVIILVNKKRGRLK